MTKTHIRSDFGKPPHDFPVRDVNRERKDRSQRLRDAVKRAGGGFEVSRRSGVPLGTLNTYLGGGEMKATNMIALAQACGVTLAWLATGQDDVQPAVPSSQSPLPAPQAPPAESRLFNTLDISKFAEALDAVIEQLGGPRFRRPTHQVVQAAVLIYDLMQEPDEAEEVTVAKP